MRRLDPTGELLVDHRALNGARKRRLVAKLYAGDLSSVYLAESDDGGERIALKVLRHVPDAGGGRLFDRFLEDTRSSRACTMRTSCGFSISASPTTTRISPWSIWVRAVLASD